MASSSSISEVNNNGDDFQSSYHVEANRNGADLRWYLPLHKAVLDGDWETVLRLCDENPDAANFIDNCPAIFTDTSAPKRTGPSSSQPPPISSGTNLDSNGIKPGKLPTAEAENDQIRIQCLPLYKATLKGDWENANRFLNEYPIALTASIAGSSSTILHIAVVTGNINFLEKLLDKILDKLPTQALAVTDKNGHTALHRAAGVGNIEAAKLLVDKLAELPNIWVDGRYPPLYSAAVVGHREMILYLLPITRADTNHNPFEGKLGVMLICNLIAGGLYGVPVKLENKRGQLNGGGMENPSDSSRCVQMKEIWFPFLKGKHFISVCQKFYARLWEAIGILAPQIKFIQDTKLMHLQALELVKCFCTEIISVDNPKASSLLHCAFLLAAEFGINEVVEIILDFFPDAVSFMRDDAYTAFHLAVMNRHENVFNLIYQTTEIRHCISKFPDSSGNNIFHLAGNLAPQHRLNLVSGAALQMQRELQWFKEVEKFVLPSDKQKENSEGKTPAMVFMDAHRELVKEGERWMKDTANSCTVASALIAIVVFAAAIKVPGGNNGDNGVPMLSKETALIVFAVSDAFSLFSSIAAVIMFLSILTSRYEQADFLYSLPNRLIIALIALFISITTMMIAFSATLYLVFGDKKAWILISVAALACLPVTLFVFLQFPILLDMIKSTYGRGSFRK